MIEIKEESYIGEGGFQKCYIHPENENRCVKVRKPRIRKNPRIEGEIKYYKKLKKKDTSKFEYNFFAQYHGEVMTDSGLGFVYDLVRDETTKEISLTLADYLKMPNSPLSDEVLWDSLMRLKHQLIEHKIVARDLTGKNICCKILKDQSIELVIVDGIGHKELLPLVDWFSFFTKMKINHIFGTKRLGSMNEHRSFLLEKDLVA